mmetsp:Transcript_2982/g.8402  ORF Transcript_2982/g.8402 Transcript_2982/m.8402 type:complete len:357 (+) Transcript_2982:7810-8880(+)
MRGGTGSPRPPRRTGPPQRALRTYFWLFLRCWTPGWRRCKAQRQTPPAPQWPALRRAAAARGCRQTQCKVPSPRGCATSAPASPPSFTAPQGPLMAAPPFSPRTLRQRLPPLHPPAPLLPRLSPPLRPAAATAEAAEAASALARSAAASARPPRPARAWAPASRPGSRASAVPAGAAAAVEASCFRKAPLCRSLEPLSTLRATLVSLVVSRWRRPLRRTPPPGRPAQRAVGGLPPRRGPRRRAAPLRCVPRAPSQEASAAPSRATAATPGSSPGMSWRPAMSSRAAAVHPWPAWQTASRACGPTSAGEPARGRALTRPVRRWAWPWRRTPWPPTSAPPSARRCSGRTTLPAAPQHS